MRKPNSSSEEKSSNSKMRKGLWSPEEDEKLINYMLSNGKGCWSDVARNAGLSRCGKSCRLRWINYLRPDLKRGAFSIQEENLIIRLHSLVGNRWSQIAARLPGRTDNEIKNFWNSTIKKRLKLISSTTPPPNTTTTSESSSPNTKHYFMPMAMEEQQDIMAMYTSPSSYVAMHNIYPVVNDGSTITPFNIYNNPNDPSCMAHLFDGTMVFEGVDMVPPLENIVLNIEDNYDNNKTDNFIDYKAEVQNEYEKSCGRDDEEIKIEEWNLEELMKDVPSFSLLQF